MNNTNSLFPKIAKSLENLIEDEEGNIPGNRLLALGTMVIVLGSLMATEVFAGHTSHSSHRSHSSHSSGSHGSHYNHESHSSHQSHQSHTSHSNTSSHSNSLYSAEGDVIYPAPRASKIPKVSVSPKGEDPFAIPEINQNIEIPNSTPSASILPAFAVPEPTPDVKLDIGTINKPSGTEKIH